TLLGDVKRLNADAVACQNQTLLGVSPNGGSEHASQSLETIGIPFEKCLKNGFSVTVALKAAAERFEFAADLKVVIDFSVENDDRVVIFGKNWLITRCQIN